MQAATQVQTTSRSELTLTADQQAALDAIEASEAREFALGGLAGTGKTTLTGILRERGLIGMTLAPTGKAAHNLRLKGAPAGTVHSAIYCFLGMEKNPKTGEMEPKFEFDEETFISPKLWTAVDESSMINEEMATDLRRTGARLLWIGDHGQLPPIGVDPGIMRNPNRKLETICRQAADSPIIALAHHVRQGGEMRTWRQRASEVEIRTDMSIRRVVDVANRTGSQVLVGFNASRHLINKEFRRTLKLDGIVQVGDRIICLRNDHRRRLFNGMQFTVNTVQESVLDDCVYMELMSVDDGSLREVDAFKPCFGRGPQDDEPDGSSLFDWAYAITTHKAQGSEWANVVIVDCNCKHWDNNRWRYTAVTRAKQRVIVFS